jgi:hypothetical protein
MNDDWRLQINLHQAVRAGALTNRLKAHQLRHDLSEAFRDRVIVTQDEDLVFLYAGSREQAEKARDLVEVEAQQHLWKIEIDLRRWHPIAEEWEDSNEPLPVDENARVAERETLMARERESATKKGYPEFEVRVDLSSHHDAVHLAEQLVTEGLPTVRRWKYLLVGVADEDSGKALAERIRDEAPTGSRVKVEGTWAAVYAAYPTNPFAVLGGLGS